MRISNIILLALALFMALSGVALAASSANYRLPLTVLSSAGGEKASTSYRVVNTVGQPAAGSLTSTNYKLQASFLGAIDLSNTPPIATNDSYSITVDTTLDIGAPGVLGNDSDPDSDPLVVDSHTQPANGSTTVSPDGSMSYTPNHGFTGDDSFDYTINDGNGGTDTALVTITVNPSAPAEAVKKLDLDVIQTPWKGYAIYQMGVSMDGLPVPVTLYSAKGLYFVEGEGLSYEDVTGFSRAVFDGQLVFNVKDGNNYSFFQFVVVHDDNGTPRYGTCFVINEQFKHWPK